MSTSFDALLGQAPVERLRAAIPAADGAPPAARKRGSIGWLEFAAGIAFGLLIAGAAFWAGFGPGSRGEQDDWRQAVVEYMELYTPDTFALANPDGAAEAQAIAGASARKVGVDLSPRKAGGPRPAIPRGVQPLL